jgi:hypothetical protein
VSNQVFQSQRDGSGNAVMGLEFDDALLAGTIAVTERPDVAVLTGQGTPGSGVIAVTERPDVVALTGDVVTMGALQTAGKPDVVALVGLGTPVVGVIAVTERPDTAILIGSGIGGTSGVIAVTERPDSVALAGVGAPARGPIAVTEQPDHINITGIGNWQGNQPFLNAFTAAYAEADDKIAEMNAEQDERMDALAEGLTRGGP